MDNWEIKLKERPQSIPLQSPEASIYQRRPQQARIPERRVKRNDWWHKPVAWIVEAILVLVHFFLNKEAIDSAGIDINEFFADSVLLGWMFQAVPELTAKEPIAFITAVFFVAVPIAAWWNLLEDEPLVTFKEKVVRAFLMSCYLFIIAGEVTLVLHRVSMGQNSFVSSGTEPAIAFFIASLFVMANSSAAFWTASIYQTSRRDRHA